MCGIGGILRVYPPGAAAPPLLESIPESWLDILDESIKHRGPDGQGRFRDRAVRADGATVDVALVHRRLSIIDIAGGAQPMVSLPPGGMVEEGFAQVEGALLFHGGPDAAVDYHRLSSSEDLVAVAFNGCIYNHIQLRKDLQSAGARFVTDHSDTEVFTHGWRQWNRQLFRRLDGMFACLIWDKRAARLVAARDAFGEKPLYSLNDDGKGHPGIAAFASSAAALLFLRKTLTRTSPQAAPGPWVKFGWDLTTPVHDLRDSYVGWCTVFAADRTDRIAAVDDTEDSFHGFWPDVWRPSRVTLTADEVDEALARSVSLRLTADVPLGCFLSGGVDSALTCHYARASRPDITAFTVRMPHPDYDESDAAKQTARHLGIRHEILDCDPRPAADLVHAITELGLPFGDSSLLPSLWVSRAARGRVKVALSGDGGDELFLGYDRHRALKYLSRLSRIPRDVLDRAASMLGSGINPKSGRSRLARLLNAAAGVGYKELTAIFPHPLDRELGVADAASRHNGMTSSAADAPDQSMLARRFDLMFYLPFDLMRKSDTASMSVALEVRAPFLSHEVAKMGIHASIDSLMPRGQRKGLLRQVARKYLPAEIVDRPKQGFAIPIGDWFRTDYGGMKTLLLDHLNAADPWPNIGVELNRRFVAQMLDEHMNLKRDHSQRLYMLLVLSIWAKAFL